MKYVKLFEDYSPESGASNNAAEPKVYMYHVYDSSEKNFHADVRDADGKMVFEIKGKTVFEGDSMMKDKNDLTGLQQMLVSKNKIKQGDTIVHAKEYEPSHSTVSAAVNTNNELSNVHQEVQ